MRQALISRFFGNRVPFLERFLSLAYLLVLFVAIIVGIALYQQHRSASRAAEVSAANLSQTLERTLSSLVDRIDINLRLIADEFSRQQGIGGVEPERIAAFLARQDSYNPDVLGFRIFGADGGFLYGVHHITDRKANVGDREYFRSLRDHPGAGLFISSPVMGRSSGRQVVILARRLNNLDGTFAGVVLGSVPIDSLIHAFSALDVGVNGAVSLYNADHILLARYPATPNDLIIGTATITDSLRAIIDQGTVSRTYQFVSPVDGFAKMGNVRKVENYPLYVLVALAKSDYLAEWTDNAGLLSAFVAFLLAFIVLSLRVINRQASELTQRSFALDRVEEAVYLMDREARFLYVNQASSKVLEYSRDELLGMSVFDINPGFARTAWAEHWRALRTLGSVTVETSHRAKSGHMVPVEICANFFKFEGREYGMSLARDITERKRALRKIEELSELNAAVIKESAHGICAYSLNGDCLLANEAMARILGATVEKLQAQNFRRIKSWEQQELLRVAEDVLVNGGTRHLTARFTSTFGRQFWADADVSAFEIEGERNLLVTFRDITEQKAAEANLRLTARIFADSQEGITIADAAGTIIAVNDAFVAITGYPREEALGRNPRFLQSGHHDSAFYQAMWKTIEATGHWKGEIWNRTKTGGIFVEMLSMSVIRDEKGEVTNYVGLFSDITVAKNHEEQLQRVAHYDALTGIPNRLLLADRMRQALAQGRRDNVPLAVCYLDLDGFKPINDTAGHEVGDKVLIEVARRLGEAVRAVDTVARIGGDEFVILLLGNPQLGAYETTLHRLLDAVCEPIIIAGKPYSVSASIGVSLSHSLEEDADTLLRQADQAMYLAKQSGRNRYHLFDAEHDLRNRERQQALARFRLGLKRGEFELFYQPKVDMLTGAIVGAEALIRWHNPERGLLLPGEFLPAIAHTDLETEVGEWVIETTLAQLGRWLEDGVAIEVSINIAASHLQSENFLTFLEERLAAHAEVPAGRLQIEVLETAALEDFPKVIAIINYCRKLGVSFSIDDFGTGYSSLSYLRNLPAETIKIDQSFVIDMLEDPGDRTIVEGIVALAKAFKLNTVAEGVESPAHIEALAAMGCGIGQGFGIARPMPASALRDMILAQGEIPLRNIPAAAEV